MAEGFGVAGANTALDALVAAYPWIKLHVGAPGSAGTANAATETTRKLASWASASAGSVATSGQLQWTSVAGSEDYTHYSAWSGSSGGSFGYSGAITANPVVIGDTITFAVGAITVAPTLAS